jgi:GT2 family glycosyltransferase
MRIAAVMTCHNRRERTLECLTSLERQRLPAEAVTVVPYVLDDGSSDGTGEAVRAAHPTAVVLDGDGTLY